MGVISKEVQILAGIWMWGMVGVLLKIRMQTLSDHGLEASGNDLRGGLVPKLPKACGAVTVEGRLKFQTT